MLWVVVGYDVWVVGGLWLNWVGFGVWVMVGSVGWDWLMVGLK